VKMECFVAAYDVYAVLKHKRRKLTECFNVNFI